MLFSEVLDSMTHHDGGFTASASDDWRQGRSIFGGLQGALALRAMRGSAPQGLPLRVLQVAFIAPLDIGPFEIHTRVLRSGKSTMHVEARLVENGQTATQALGIFGRGRPSRVERVPEPTPVPHQEPMLAPFVAGLTPNFTQHFAMRWLYGGFPFSNTKVPLAVIEVSLTDSAKTREEHVVAIADAIPPVALSMLETSAPGSSLTWTLEMLRDHFDDLPLAGWRLHAELNAGREGYTSQSVLVCDPRGAPAALSHQSMVVFG